MRTNSEINSVTKALENQNIGFHPVVCTMFNFTTYFSMETWCNIKSRVTLDNPSNISGPFSLSLFLLHTTRKDILNLFM